MDYIIEQKPNGKFILKVRTGIISVFRLIGWGYAGAFFPNEYDSIEESEKAALDFLKKQDKNKIVKIGTINDSFIHF